MYLSRVILLSSLIRLQSVVIQKWEVKWWMFKLEETLRLRKDPESVKVRNITEHINFYFKAL